MVAPMPTAPKSHACLRAAEQHLIGLVRIGQQLVVVDLRDERDAVRIAARRHAEHAEGRRDRVAAALDGELHDVDRVEVRRVRREGGRRAVLDALVDGEDRDIARAREPAVAEKRSEVSDHGRVAVGVDEDPVDVVGARQRELVARDGLRRVAEQRLGLITEEGCDVGHAASVPLGLRAGAIRRPSPAPPRSPCRRTWPGASAPPRSRRPRCGSGSRRRPGRSACGPCP